MFCFLIVAWDPSAVKGIQTFFRPKYQVCCGINLRSDHLLCPFFLITSYRSQTASPSICSTWANRRRMTASGELGSGA